MTGAWPMVSLGEICEIQRGGSPRPISSYITESEEGINWIKIGDVAVGAKYLSSTEEKIKPEGAKRSRMVYPGDFILSNSMSFGRPYIMRTSGCIHDGWLVLRDTNKRLSEDYLYRVLGSDFVVSQFKKMAVGAVVKNLNKEVVQAVVIPLPPLPEQRRIAAILDHADALRAKRREALAQLDSLTQSIFIEMFGDPVQNTENWPIKTLKELGRVKTGGTPPSAKEGMFNGEIPFVTPGDLGRNGPAKRTVTTLGAAEAETVRGGSALVCCIGATIGKMAKASQFCAFNQQINAVEWGAAVDDDFGICALEFFKAHIATQGASTTLPILKKSSFEKIEIPNPPLAIQQTFAIHIQALNVLKASHRAALAELNTLFASLQHRAFRGEL